MNRAYYKNSISNFISEHTNSILGQLSLNHTNRSLEDLQKNAWIKQIEIFKNQLVGLQGFIYFEFAIPRMGKRVDNIIIIEDSIFVIEFKIGDGNYQKHAISQVIDYTLDLRNFHAGSHDSKLIPVLIATNALETSFKINEVLEFNDAAKCNKDGIKNTLQVFINPEGKRIDVEKWEHSAYKPTPTIVEAAQALYKGHKVEEISRFDSAKVLVAPMICLRLVFLPAAWIQR